MTGLLERSVHSRAGQRLLSLVGLPEPADLRRGKGYRASPIRLAAIAGSNLLATTLDLLGLEPELALTDQPGTQPEYPKPVGALLIDACGLEQIEQTEAIRAALRPAMRNLSASGRIILLAGPAEASVASQAANAALSGIVRSVAKELRNGATANLVRVAADTTPGALAGTIAFLLSGRSAFVSGQCWQVGAAVEPSEPPSSPALQDQVVVVTGAARGIGARIAQVAAREGARVICVDVPAAGEPLTDLANRIRGTALQLDITEPHAGDTIAALIAERFGDAGTYAIVHNAGITRDKLLVNTDAERWAQVLEVNLAAQLRINDALLDGRPGGLRDGGRLVAISSTSGIAGNRGQVNYAASKAGVIGVVAALSKALTDRRITVNAAAPGFIQTEMTARIPFLQREIFQRSNSLGQAGLPIDVAELVGYFLDPANSAVNGQVVRVCGQNLVGR